jgi:S1-C subfamily serine protease
MTTSQVGSVRALAVAILLAPLLTPTTVRAAEWIEITHTSRDSVVEIEAGGIKREGNIAHYWIRESFSNPYREDRFQKPYSILLNEVFADCGGGLVAKKAWATQDYAGNPIAGGSYDSEWGGVQPGTVDEMVFKTVCSATTTQPKPFLEDIMAGGWTDIGSSSGNSAGEVSIKAGDVVRLTPDHVVVNSRTDLPRRTSIDGVPVKYIVGATVIDCSKAQWALYGVDYYLTRSFRVNSKRADARSLEFKAIVPGDQLSTTYRQLCKDAKVMPGVTRGVQTPPSAGFSLGTAWATNKGYLITANHVVADGSTIEVYSDGELVGEAHVIAADPANDLAVLKLQAKPGRLLRILPLASHAAVLGRSVFTLGYPEPEVMGQKVKMTSGEVSATTGFQDDVRFLQISAPIQPGNSGGPVIAWDGEVVGVVDSSLDKLPPEENEPSPAPQAVNYAIKISYLRPLLEDLPDLGGYEAVKPVPDRDGMVAAARRAVFMLVVKVGK